MYIYVFWHEKNDGEVRKLISALLLEIEILTKYGHGHQCSHFSFLGKFYVPYLHLIMPNEDSLQHLVHSSINHAGMEKNTRGGQICPLLSILGLMKIYIK